MKSPPSLGSSYKRRWRSKLVRKCRAEQRAATLCPDALVVPGCEARVKAKPFNGSVEDLPGYQKSRAKYSFLISLTIYFLFFFFFFFFSILLSAVPWQRASPSPYD